MFVQPLPWTLLIFCQFALCVSSITAQITAVPMSELTKQRVSAAKKGKSNWSKGVPKSAEQRAKISETLKGHTPWNKGVKLTEEQVEILRQRATGRKHSEETLAKMRMRTHTEETKQKMRAAHAARKNGALK